MGRLTPQTLSNYRVKLRKLRAVLAVMEEVHPERLKVVKEIESLTNKLGLEMTDLEIALSRGPGRPRQHPLIDDELIALARAEKEQRERESERKETKEEREARIETRRQEFMRNYEKEHPEVLTETQISQQQLDDLMKLGGDEKK